MTADPKAQPSTGELVADIRETRANVAADVEAIKAQLTATGLKARALDAAERSVESLALQVGRKLLQAPMKLARVGRRHPAASLVVGAGLVLLLWKTSRSR